MGSIPATGSGQGGIPASPISTATVQISEAKKKDKQEQVLLIAMLMALLSSLGTTSRAAIARSLTLSQDNQLMQTLSSQLGQGAFMNIPDKTKTNTGELINAQAQNKEVMSMQAAGNAVFTQLQQNAQIKSSDAAALAQQLAALISQITGGYEALKDITYSANITRPPSS